MTIHKIVAIELGWGDNSIYFSTSVKPSSRYHVDEIRECEKEIGCKSITTYVGFKDGYPLFQMIAGSNITLYFQPTK